MTRVVMVATSLGQGGETHQRAQDLVHPLRLAIEDVNLRVRALLQAMPPQLVSGCGIGSSNKSPINPAQHENAGNRATRGKTSSGCTYPMAEQRHAHFCLQSQHTKENLFSCLTERESHHTNSRSTIARRVGRTDSKFVSLTPCNHQGLQTVHRVKGLQDNQYRNQSWL